MDKINWYESTKEKLEGTLRSLEVGGSETGQPMIYLQHIYSLVKIRQEDRTPIVDRILCSNSFPTSTIQSFDQFLVTMWDFLTMSDTQLIRACIKGSQLGGSKKYLRRDCLSAFVKLLTSCAVLRNADKLRARVSSFHVRLLQDNHSVSATPELQTNYDNDVSITELINMKDELLAYVMFQRRVFSEAFGGSLLWVSQRHLRTEQEHLIFMTAEDEHGDLQKSSMGNVTISALSLNLRSFDCEEFLSVLDSKWYKSEVLESKKKTRKKQNHEERKLETPQNIESNIATNHIANQNAISSSDRLIENIRISQRLLSMNPNRVDIIFPVLESFNSLDLLCDPLLDCLTCSKAVKSTILSEHHGDLTKDLTKLCNRMEYFVQRFGEWVSLMNEFERRDDEGILRASARKKQEIRTISTEIVDSSIETLLQQEKILNSCISIYVTTVCNTFFETAEGKKMIDNGILSLQETGQLPTYSETLEITVKEYFIAKRIGKLGMNLDNFFLQRQTDLKKKLSSYYKSIAIPFLTFNLRHQTAEKLLLYQWQVNLNSANDNSNSNISFYCPALDTSISEYDHLDPSNMDNLCSFEECQNEHTEDIHRLPMVYCSSCDKEYCKSCSIIFHKRKCLGNHQVNSITNTEHQWRQTVQQVLSEHPNLTQDLRRVFKEICEDRVEIYRRQAL